MIHLEMFCYAPLRKLIDFLTPHSRHRHRCKGDYLIVLIFGSVDSAFKQQRLPAWQPVLTAGTVLPTFFIIGILFIPVGVGLLYFSDEVRELILDYTDCKSAGSVAEPCAEKIEGARNVSCVCEIDFTLNRDFEGKVFMYYGLTNYYQNHRRYVKSRDDDQLLGKLSASPSSDCNPFRDDSNNMPVAPCGAIANSLFSGKWSNVSASMDWILIIEELYFRYPGDLCGRGHQARFREGANAAYRNRLAFR